MNTIQISQIAQGKIFTEDSYVFENLFFLPKSLPIMDYHIKLLKKWNIDKIYCFGILTDIKTQKEEEKEDRTLEDIFDSPNNVLKIEEEVIDEASPIVETVEDFKSTYKKWILTTISFFNAIITTKTIDKEKVVNILNDIKLNVKKNKNECLKMFGKQIEGIPYIHRKTIETTILGYIISESMQLTEFTTSNLLFATLFHDLGMLKVPKEILQKKGALTKEDLTEIQNHTIYGYKYLREIGYSAIVASGALQHHERIDGKGYPNHVSLDKITEIAKIIAVVDAYCAAIADKPFRNTLHAKEAIQDLLKSGGSAYEPSILRELVKNISFYPIGSLVLLSDNNPAEVAGTSGVAMRPIVKIIKTKETIDLSKRNDIYIKGIYSNTNEQT